MLLGLAGEEGDAQIQGLLQLGRQAGQHGQGAADMEAADGHRQSSGAEAPRQVQGAGVLVGLDPHQADQATPAVGLEAPDDASHRDPGVGLVIGLDGNPDIRAQDPLLVGDAGQTVEGGQGVGGNPGLAPLDDITLVVIVGGFDQLQQEGAGTETGQGGARGTGLVMSANLVMDAGLVTHGGIVMESGHARRGGFAMRDGPVMGKDDVLAVGDVTDRGG